MQQAAFLDPRFKSLPYLTETQRTHLASSIAEKCLRLQNDLHDNDQDIEDARASTTEVAVIEPASKRPALSSLLGDVFSDSSTCRTAAADKCAAVKREVELYIHTNNPNLNASPLEWWQRHEIQYPSLSKLAKQLLVVQATSVPSERVFSVAGDTISPKRSCLEPEMADAIIFLNKNFELINLNEL